MMMDVGRVQGRKQPLERCVGGLRSVFTCRRRLRLLAAPLPSTSSSCFFVLD